MLLGLLLFISACDPGFEYDPIDWLPTGESLSWEKDFGDFKVEAPALWGLIGNSWIDPEFKVTNYSGLPVVLESADLHTKKRDFAGKLPDHGDLKWRTAGPVGSRSIIVSWDFQDNPAPNALGDRPSIKLIFRVGEKRVPVEISYWLKWLGKFFPGS